MDCSFVQLQACSQTKCVIADAAFVFSLALVNSLYVRWNATLVTKRQVTDVTLILFQSLMDRSIVLFQFSFTSSSYKYHIYVSSVCGELRLHELKDESYS